MSIVFGKNTAQCLLFVLVDPVGPAHGFESRDYDFFVILTVAGIQVRSNPGSMS